jgi:hypothetical protein
MMLMEEGTPEEELESLEPMAELQASPVDGVNNLVLGPAFHVEPAEHVDGISIDLRGSTEEWLAAREMPAKENHFVHLHLDRGDLILGWDWFDSMK